MQMAGNAMMETIMKSCCLIDNRDKGMCHYPQEKTAEFRLCVVLPVRFDDASSG
jgi:hypothetical protein